MSERKDAVRNRARIITAAEDVFRAAGARAPLDLVAQRAGVGRATLYRHFPDRGALIAAVYAQRIETLEEIAASVAPAERFERLVAAIGEMQRDVPGMLAAVQAARGGPERLAEVEQRTRSLVAAALREARRHGSVREDVTIADAMLVFAMVEGVIAATEPARVAAAVRRAAAIALRGLRAG